VKNAAIVEISISTASKHVSSVDGKITFLGFPHEVTSPAKPPKSNSNGKTPAGPSFV
jgi:hypothetical protein